MTHHDVTLNMFYELMYTHEVSHLHEKTLTKCVDMMYTHDMIHNDITLILSHDM